MKKWIAGLLAIALVMGLMTGLTLTAGATELNDINHSAWWTYWGEGIEIDKDGVEITFTATTQGDTTDDTSNWNGPCYFVYSGKSANTVGTTGPWGTVTDYAEHWIQRGDNYGWSTSGAVVGYTSSGIPVAVDGDDENTTVDDNEIFAAWTSHRANLLNGASCKIWAIRIDNNVVVTLDIEGVSSTVTIPVSSGEGMKSYICLTPDAASITDIVVSPLDYSDDSIPDINFDGWWVSKTRGVAIDEAGIDITFTNKTYASGNAKHNGPLWILYSGDVPVVNSAGYTEYWVQRGDSWGWHGDLNTNCKASDLAGIGIAYTSNAPADGDTFWDSYLTNMKAGCDGTISAIKQSNGDILVYMDFNGIQSTVTLDNPGKDVYISLTGELNTLSNITVTPHEHTPGTIDGDCTNLPCTICGKGTGTGATAHTYTYAAEGAVITESCSVEGCTAHSATATITAPAGAVEDGTKHNATLAYSDGWKGGELDITYSPSDPVTAGDYTASITIGGATASAVYSISNHQHVYTYALNSDHTVITQTCTVAGCDHSATATIAAPSGDLTADGTKKFEATVTTSSTWVGDAPVAAYTIDTVAATDLTKGGAYKASITVGEVTAYVEYAVHAHSYTYAANGGKLTETCSCGHTATATITAPSGTLYSGSEHNATVVYDSAWAGEKPAVTHKLGTTKVDTTSAAGAYTAEITVGGKTASVTFTVAERPAGTLADLDGTGWWAAHTEGIEITKDGIEITFKNTSYAEADKNWFGPLWVLYTGTEAKVNGAGYAEYWVERGDLYGWAGADLKAYKGVADATAVDTGDNAANLPSVGVTHNRTTEPNWDTFLEGLKAGTDCKIVAKRDGANIVVTFTVNGAVSDVTVPFPADKVAYISLTAEKAKLTNINYIALDPVVEDDDDTGSSDTGSSDTGSSDTGSSDTGSSDTGSSDTGSSDTGSSDTGSSDTGSSDTGSSDTGSSGSTSTTLPDMDIGGFWSAHSTGLELTADGIDITFTSTSANAANNWEGPIYILYTGDEAKVNGAGYSELWVQRGDNFGWNVDGKNNLDNMADLNAAGITYESSCADWDALWASYIANLKAGCEVHIHAELKDGKAVVTMTLQGLTMTTSVPVPEGETVYLSVSGENTKLSDISVKTGDPIAIVLALLAVSGTGIAVLLKKKEF